MNACTFYETIKRYRCLVSESVKGRNIITWNNILVKVLFWFWRGATNDDCSEEFCAHGPLLTELEVDGQAVKVNWMPLSSLPGLLTYADAFIILSCSIFAPHIRIISLMISRISFFFIFSLDGINSSSFTFTRPFLCRNLLRSVLGLLLTCMLPLKCRPRPKRNVFSLDHWTIYFFSNYFESFVSF